MQEIFIESTREGRKEKVPLGISYISPLDWRRLRLAELLQAEHVQYGCIEESRNRDCRLYISENPRSGLAVVKHRKPEVVITDSRFQWTTGCKDGIDRVIKRLRQRGYRGKIFCLGFYGVETDAAKKAGADSFMEEDDAFRLQVAYSQYMVCEGIRSLLERPPFTYFPEFPNEDFPNFPGRNV